MGELSSVYPSWFESGKNRRRVAKGPLRSVTAECGIAAVVVYCNQRPLGPRCRRREFPICRHARLAASISSKPAPAASLCPACTDATCRARSRLALYVTEFDIGTARGLSFDRTRSRLASCIDTGRGSLRNRRAPQSKPASKHEKFFHVLSFGDLLLRLHQLQSLR